MHGQPVDGGRERLNPRTAPRLDHSIAIATDSFGVWVTAVLAMSARAMTATPRTAIRGRAGQPESSSLERFKRRMGGCSLALPSL
jgi:hypothetical protein